MLAVRAINRGLASLGAEVTVLTTNVGLEDRVPPGGVLDDGGVKVKYLPYYRGLEFFGATGWQFSPDFKKAAEEEIPRHDAAHVVGVWNFPSAWGMKLCSAAKIPFLVSPEGALGPDKLAIKSWKKRAYYKLIVEPALRKAAGLHYFTDAEADESLKYLRLPVPKVVIPNGIDKNAFAALPEKGLLARKFPKLAGKTIILFLGRLHRIKGLDILVKAFASIAPLKRNLHLLLAGPDCGFKSELETQIAKLGIAREVTFAGMLDDNAKLEALAGSDIFILPSYSEAFSVAIVEAMAAGLPVVISNKCHFNEVADSGAGFVTEPTEEAVSAALSRLVESSRDRAAMGARGKELVFKKYSWDSISREFLSGFNSMIKREHGTI